MAQPIIFTVLRISSMLSLFAFETSFGQIQIDPNRQPSLEKPGFNLIFTDDFNSFQPTIWNRSVPGDDLWPYSDPAMCSKTAETPSNIWNVLSPTGGRLKIRVREGEEQNACDYSGGEIKSFSTQVNNPVKHWKVLPNTYLEARVKVPECKGVGAAFWLYGLVSSPQRFMEVDMFEIYGDEESKFQANIHFGKTYEPFHWSSPQQICVENLEGDDVRLSDQFLMFGVYHDNTKIELTLNGVHYRTYYMSLYGGGNNNYNYYRRPSPFNVRLGSNSTPVGSGTTADCDDLPTYFEIDYVRLWQKSGTQAIKLTDSKISLCSDLPWGDGANVSVPNYPGAQYSWESTPFFNFGPSGFDSGCNCVGWWTSVIPGTPAGLYPVNLTVTFTGGHQEQVTLLIQVTSGVPPTPNEILIFNDHVQVYQFGVEIASGTTGYEYSIDGGQIWERVPNPTVGKFNIWPKEFLDISSPYSAYVCVRAYTNCGVSAPLCKYRTVPTSDCPYCRLTMLNPHEVLVEESSPDVYRLKVNKSLYSQSYDWSFDQDYWYNVENTSSAYNYFGEFPAGTEAFRIYVRGRNADTLTGVYSQDIIFPQALSSNGRLDDAIKETREEESTQERDIRDEGQALNDFQYVLLNMLGQIVLKGEGGQIEISDFKQKISPGIYILLLEEPYGRKSARKIFISNQY